jgi:hypothetical protein
MDISYWKERQKGTKHGEEQDTGNLTIAISLGKLECWLKECITLAQIGSQ